MSYIIICSTKILTLAIAPSLFISVGVLCEFAMMLGVYTVVLLPSRKKRFTLLLERSDLHIWQQIHKKYLKICLPLYYSANVIVEL